MKIIKENVKYENCHLCLAKEKSHQRTIQVRKYDDEYDLTEELKVRIHLPDFYYLIVNHRHVHLLTEQNNSLQNIYFKHSKSTDCIPLPIKNTKSIINYYWNSPFDVWFDSPQQKIICQEPLKNNSFFINAFKLLTI